MAPGGDELVGAGQDGADFQAGEVGALADQEAPAGQRLVDLDRGPGGLGQADEQEVGQRGGVGGTLAVGPGGAKAGDLPEPVEQARRLDGNQLDGALRCSSSSSAASAAASAGR